MWKDTCTFCSVTAYFRIDQLKLTITIFLIDPVGVYERFLSSVDDARRCNISFCNWRLGLRAAYLEDQVYCCLYYTCLSVRYLLSIDINAGVM